MAGVEDEPLSGIFGKNPKYCEISSCAHVQGIDLRYTNEYEKVFIIRFLKCQICTPQSYRSLREEGVVQLIYELRRSRWDQPLRLVPYNMFQALVDQFECTINDISDNFEAMTEYLYTPEEAINGKALTPRVKERELFIVEAGGKLPTCIKAFTQEFTEGQREVQFLYEFDYQQVPDLELAGAVRGKDHIKYTVPPVETLKMLFNETFDAIQR
jgi:hypothetical protein